MCQSSFSLVFLFSFSIPFPSFQTHTIIMIRFSHFHFIWCSFVLPLAWPVPFFLSHVFLRIRNVTCAYKYIHIILMPSIHTSFWNAKVTSQRNRTLLVILKKKECTMIITFRREELRGVPHGSMVKMIMYAFHSYLSWLPPSFYVFYRAILQYIALTKLIIKSWACELWAHNDHSVFSL